MASPRGILLFLVGIQIISYVQSGAILDFSLSSYNNVNHELADGSCCDNAKAPCTNPCDNRFVVCLKRDTSSDSCDYKFSVDGPTGVDDPDFFEFPESAHSSVWLDSWTGSIGVDVQILDVDGESSQEKVGEVIKTVELSAGSSSTCPWSHFGEGKGIELDFSLKVYCDTNFYGSSCTRYCRGRDTTAGHYTCGEAGNKVCMDGWTGSRCNEAI